MQDHPGEIYKYSLVSDFLLLREGFLPPLIGEVISDQEETDKYRMILQCAVIARLGNILTRDNHHFVAQAVRLNRNFTAERYLACVEKSVCMFHVCLVMADTALGCC